MTKESIALLPGFKNSESVWRILKLTGLPLATRCNMMRRILRWRTPGEAKIRKDLLPVELKPTTIAALPSLKLDGFCQLAPDFAPEASTIAAELHRIYQVFRMKSDKIKSDKSKKIDFLRTIMSDAEFLDSPSILDFVTGDNFLELAAVYLGEAPVLSAVNLWWSPVNTTAQSSQLFHFDEADDQQIKFFLNCVAVGLENGPFTLVPARTSKKVFAEVGTVHGRFSDEIVAKHLKGQPPISLIGPAGALAAVDSSRCLHFGSRGNSMDRIILMFQFVRFSAPRSERPNWGQKIFDFAASKPPLVRRALWLT